MSEPGYRVVLTPAAQRQLERLRGPLLAALRGIILALADEPLPVGARKLAGTDDLWRIRARIDGQPWRVVYQLRAAERVVVVTRVVRRDESTYRGLSRHVEPSTHICLRGPDRSVPVAYLIRSKKSTSCAVRSSSSRNET